MDAAGTRKTLDAALDAGVTLLDTADIYGSHPGESEEMLGEVLGSRPGRVRAGHQVRRRHEGANGPDWGARGSRRYIRIAVEASLRRLRTDHIDLLPAPHARTA